MLATFGVGIYRWIVKSAEPSVRIMSLSCFWSLIIGVIGIVLFNPSFSQEDFSRTFNEEAGRIPLSGPDNDESRIIRQFIREEINFRQEAAAASAKVKTREMQDLLSPASFRSREVVEETIRQLQQYNQLSARFESGPRMMQQNLNKAIATLPNSRQSASLKDFAKGVETSIQESSDAHQKEQQYLLADIDLYEFVSNNFSDFSIAGDHVFVADESILSEFKRRLSDVQQLAREYKISRDQVEAKRKRSESALGIG